MGAKLSDDDLVNLTKDFEKYDSNKDKTLSRDEFKQLIIVMIPNLKSEEVNIAAEKGFNKCDTNKNGKVELSEFISYYKRKYFLDKSEKDRKQHMVEKISKKKTKKDPSDIYKVK